MRKSASSVMPSANQPQMVYWRLSKSAMVGAHRVGLDVETLVEGVVVRLEDGSKERALASSGTTARRAQCARRDAYDALAGRGHLLNVQAGVVIRANESSFLMLPPSRF